VWFVLLNDLKYRGSICSSGNDFAFSPCGKRHREALLQHPGLIGYDNFHGSTPTLRTTRRYCFHEAWGSAIRSAPDKTTMLSALEPLRLIRLQQIDGPRLTGILTK
jgi:hypothetical protein